LIVGAGPAGIFTAFWLMENGVLSRLIEQGDPMPLRGQAAARFMREGILDEQSNICFGAGGAGAWSDGKLFTRIRSGWIHTLNEVLIRFGAPPEIRFESKPHLGSSRIRAVFRRILDFLERGGVEIFYRTRFEDLECVEFKGRKRVAGIRTSKGDFSAESVFLAAGHSARPVYECLAKIGAELRFKPFAAGIRVEHPAEWIDRIQFGRYAGHPALGHAAYRLAAEIRQRGVYTFCMCPGGYVLNASTENGGMVVNGMSQPRRENAFSNAAVVVSISGEDLSGTDVFRGIRFQRELERRFAEAVNPKGRSAVVPAVRLVDFVNGRAGRKLPQTSMIHPVAPLPLHRFFPPFMREALSRGIRRFDRKMPGFLSGVAVAMAVESRTSSPVCVVRSPDTFQSTSIDGLYPVGEGAGYAGGITSSAIDGLSAAECFLEPRRGR
jgi:hypothetical protein